MTTTTSDKPRRLPLKITITPGDPFDRTFTLAGDQDPVRLLSNILERYYAILHRSTPKFSDTELCAIFEALGEHWDPTPANIHNLAREVGDAITADLLDTKWRIDATHFRNRLDRTGFHERAALAELASCYWTLATEDQPPQATIATIKQLFRPDPSQRPTSVRPRRIPVHHFADTTAPPDDPDNSDTDNANDTGAADTTGQRDDADVTTPAQLPAHLDIDDAGDSPTSGDTNATDDNGDTNQHQATDTQTPLPDTP